MERENEFFNLDDELVEFAEMNGFDFVSGKYITKNEECEIPRALKQENFDFFGMLKNLFQTEKLAEK